MKWTQEPKDNGLYICRHFWEDGTQSGTDYLYRLDAGKWVNLIGEPDKRLIGHDEAERVWYFGPIPGLLRTPKQNIDDLTENTIVALGQVRAEAPNNSLNVYEKAIAALIQVRKTLGLKP